MDINDFLAILTYILFLFFIITFTASLIDKIHYVGNTKIDPSDDNNKIVTLTYHGSKPKYRAKLVIKGFSKKDKQQIRRSQWNIFELLPLS